MDALFSSRVRPTARQPLKSSGLNWTSLERSCTRLALSCVLTRSNKVTLAHTSAEHRTELNTTWRLESNSKFWVSRKGAGFRGWQVSQKVVINSLEYKLNKSCCGYLEGVFVRRLRVCRICFRDLVAQHV